MKDNIRLGVNIDHVATLRNARGGNDPSVLEAAFLCQRSGADSITVHLREDRRHIRDADVSELLQHLKIPLNLEMAVTPEMTEIALKLKPSSVCLVPENRREVTTEGGLDVKGAQKRIAECSAGLSAAGIRIFAFVEPDAESIRRCADMGLTGVEIHTGKYAAAFKTKEFEAETARITTAARETAAVKMKFHAGHGLNYFNMGPLLRIENLAEVNIGHAIISRAVSEGLPAAVSVMKRILVS